ncbi:MAG: PfkB family carbohydrate kinase [Granulosicoccus sp.]
MHETARSVLIVGAAHIDEIAYPDNILQAHASNPVHWQRRLGGVGINVALAACDSRPTATIRFMAAVGDDTAGAQLAKTLDRELLESQLITIPGQTTGRYAAIINEHGELYIGLADVSVAEALTPQALLPFMIPARSDTLVLDANLSVDCLAQLARWQKEQPGDEHCATIALAVSPTKAVRLKPLASQIDTLFCNRREASALTGQQAESPAGQLADGLLQVGFRCFVLTDGGEPLLVQTANNREHISVAAVDRVKQVNGAGDALAGATIAALADGCDIGDALRDSGLPAAAAILTGTTCARSIK